MRREFAAPRVDADRDEVHHGTVTTHDARALFSSAQLRAGTSPLVTVSMVTAQSSPGAVVLKRVVSSEIDTDQVSGILLAAFAPPLDQ
jgi:predicted transcriptional regulator